MTQIKQQIMLSIFAANAASICGNSFAVNL